MTDQPEKKSDTEDGEGRTSRVTARAATSSPARSGRATSPTSRARPTTTARTSRATGSAGPDEKIGDDQASSAGVETPASLSDRLATGEAPPGRLFCVQRSRRGPSPLAAAVEHRLERLEQPQCPARRPRVRSSSAAIRATTAAPPSPCSATARARRAVCSRSSPIAAWFANMIRRSISPSENARSLRAVEHLEHAEHRVAVRERHRHQALRHVARALGRLAREARVLLEVVDHDRLAGDEHPARDARARGNPHPDQVALALARDGLEDELVRRRRRAGRSTTPWRRRSPARRRRSTAAARDGSPPTGASRSPRPPGSSSHPSSACLPRWTPSGRGRSSAGRASAPDASRARAPTGRRCAVRRSCCRSPAACCRRTTPRRGRCRGRRTRRAGWDSRTTPTSRLPRATRPRSPTRSATDSSRPACCAPRRRAPCR